jgi:hypothetical protein
MNMKSSFFAAQNIYIIWRRYVQLGSSFPGFLVLFYFWLSQLLFIDRLWKDVAWKM